MQNTKDGQLETNELDLKSVIAILRRRRRLIGLTVVAVLGLALIYLLLASPVYRATALLLVDSRGSNLLDASAGQSEQSAVLNSRVDSEVEILRSDATLLAVVEAAALVSDPEFGPRLGIMEKIGVALGIDGGSNALRSLIGLPPSQQPDGQDLVKRIISELRSMLDVRRRGLTYLIAVSVSSGDPDKAASIANIYAQTYLERQVAAKTQSTLEASEVLRLQIETAREQLAASELAVNKYIEDNLSRLEAESGDPAVAALRRRLETAQTEVRQGQAVLAGAETAILGGDWESAAQSLGDAALAELASQRAELERRLAGAASGSTEAADLSVELALLDDQLAKASSESIERVRQNINSIDERQSAARDELRAALLQSDLSAEMLAKLFELQQSASIARSQYQTLLARRQDFGTMANLQIADARIVSQALPPESPVSPNKRLILVMAIVGGLGLGIGLAFLKEYYVGGIASSGQLRNVLQARVPVTIPQVETPTTGSPADLVVTAAMSPYAETFRKLRAAIDLSLDTRDEPREGLVILVSSALPVEGKTTAAIALARTYALAGEHTLVIDADLRKPSVGAQLGVESEVGVYQYLSQAGASRTDQLIPVADPLSPLMALTASGRSAAPTDQLINSDAFRMLVKTAREVFDIVFIDTPPLLPLVDTRYLARYADVVVHVVRYGTTTQGEVRETASLLHEMMRPDAKYFGILSHEERGAQGYGYYGRYGYYGEAES